MSAVFLLLPVAVGAKSLWLIEEGRLTRMDVGSGALATVATAGYVYNVAPVGNRDAWVLTDNALVLLGADLTEAARSPLTASEAKAIGPMVADRSDGGVWFASGSALVHLDGAGVRIREIVVDDKVSAIAIAGPDALYAATATELLRLDSTGARTARVDLTQLSGGNVIALLADSPAGYLWLAREGALFQFDVLAGMTARAAHPISGLDAVGIDAASGIVAIVSGQAILRFARNEATALPGTLVSGDLVDLSGIEVGSGASFLWFGDRAGFGAIDVTNGIVLRTMGAPVARFAPDPLRLEPRLEVDTSTASATDTQTLVVLQFRAYCDGLACQLSPSYLQGLRLRAMHDDLDVSSAFTPNASRDRFSGRLPLAPWQSGAPLRAWVTDPYGNRSNVAAVRWPVIANAGNAQFVEKAAPTITITAPANNATFTAPATTTIKATVTASTGATITKVDFYAGATLLGTVTTSPYNFTWANVQVGTYALTAKVTDSLNATATSTVVNVTVNAGAMAKPLNAYLLNDAWATSLVVTDAAGTKNGVPTGTVTAVTSTASAPKSDTCKAASFAGGAIDVAALTVSTAAAAKVTIAFWMFWNGTDAVMPIGWVTEGLILSGGSFGFTTQNSDVYGIASTGLASKWHHVVAEFNNGAPVSAKLYLDGVLQTLTQRAGTPLAANAVVAATLRIGGLTGNTGLRFAGQLDEIKVFNRALTPTEVSAEFAAANACGSAPTVSLTAPANNANFVAPATIGLTATAAATATGATLTKVEFYNGTTLLSTSTTSPYAYTWNSVAVGNYSLTAKATDSKGATATSTVAAIHVKANVPPAVSITAPANNAAYTAPATVNITATASDSDGTVTKVDFYQGGTKLATATTAPYAYTWNNVAGGNYALTAKATDDKGAVTTSATVNIKVNKPPTVNITAPANNAVFVLPATVAINVSATDADGTISKVEFYHDGVLLGTDTTSPYSYSWVLPGAGTYALTAKATDNLGAVTTSGTVTITANPNKPPTISITSPVSGASVFSDIPITISATGTDTDGTISKVDFYADNGSGPIKLGTDTTSPYSIAQALSAGTNILTAVATDNKGGVTTSAPVTVMATPNMPPAIVMTLPNINPQYFVTTTAPNVTLAASASDSDGHVVAVRFYKQSFGVNGDPSPVLLGTVATAPYQVTWNSVPYTDPPPGGVNIDYYLVWAEATDDIGAVTAADPVTIYVLATAPPSQYVMEFKMPASYISTFQLIYDAPATIILGAAVRYGGDPGLATKVELVANGTTIATLTPADANGNNYMFVWRNVAAGTYTITANLTDMYGFKSTSDPLQLTVLPATPRPAITLQQPPSEQTVYLSAGVAPPDIPYLASTPDPTAFDHIEFDDSNFYLGYLTAPPFSGTVSGPRAGIHMIKAVGMDKGTWANTWSAPSFTAVPLLPRPPVAVLTSPSPTGSYSNSVPVPVTAEVVAMDGAIAKVEFYDGPYLIKTLTTAPWTTNLVFSAGTHSVYAIAYAPFRSGVTTPVTFSVSGTGSGEKISITSPSAEQHFYTPVNITLTANVTDPSGMVSLVSFYAQRNGPPIATISHAPWTTTWLNVAAADYTLTAVAQYSGGSVTSTPVTIHVTTNQPPTISITSPRTGQTFYVGQVVPIVASASDPDGTLTKVEFFVNGTLAGTVTSPPYTYNWAPAATGSYALTAKATDDAGASTTTASAVNVTVNANALPAVALVLPQSGQTFSAGGTIYLAATASDTDGSVSRVDFYSGSTLLGSTYWPTFTFTWANVPAGSYSVTARAVDDRGAVTTSTAVAIQVVNSALTVTSPAANASIAADFVVVNGTYSAPPNTGITINGVVALNDGHGAFFTNDVPLQPGANTITVVLTTADGASITRTVDVTSTAMAPFRVSLSADSDYAPVTSSINIESRSANAIASFSASANCGSLAFPAPTATTLGTFTVAPPGICTVTVNLTDSTGATYSQQLSLLALDKTALDQLARATWSNFALALAGGSKNAAMSTLSGSAQAKYGPVFTILAPYMPQIVASWSAPKTGTIAPDRIELGVNQNFNGTNALFLIYLIQDRYGIWRIDTM